MIHKHLPIQNMWAVPPKAVVVDRRYPFFSHLSVPFTLWCEQVGYASDSKFSISTELYKICQCFFWRKPSSCSSQQSILNMNFLGLGSYTTTNDQQEEFRICRSDLRRKLQTLQRHKNTHKLCRSLSKIDRGSIPAQSFFSKAENFRSDSSPLNPNMFFFGCTPETNIVPEFLDGWKTTFSFWKGWTC